MDPLLSSVFVRPEVSDFAIIIGDQRINVHKSVLMSSSEYFSALFNSEMIETKTSEISLKDTLVKPFLIVLKLSYDISMTDEEWMTLKIQELFESIIIASKYQFLECERQLSDKLIEVFNHRVCNTGDASAVTSAATDEDSMLTIWELLEMAKLHNLLYLTDLCLRFFDENISYAFKTFDKQFISGDIVLDVISRDTFGAHEYDIYQLVKKWIRKCRIRSNQKSVEESLLLDSVRLNLMSLEELKEVQKKGLYESERLDYVAKHESNPIMAQNKRICYESGKIFRAENPSNELHLRDERVVVVFFTFELSMPSKINHLFFIMKPTDPIVDLNANYSILIADRIGDDVVYRQVLDYKQCSCIGEQELYFNEPFVTSTIRIVVECGVQEVRPPIAESEDPTRQLAATSRGPITERRRLARCRYLPTHRQHPSERMLTIQTIYYEYSKNPLKVIDSFVVPDANVCQKLGSQCLSTQFDIIFMQFLNRLVLNHRALGVPSDDSNDKFVNSFDDLFEMRFSPEEVERDRQTDTSMDNLFKQHIQQPITTVGHYLIRLPQPIVADCLQFELVLENETHRKFDECLAAECRVELCPAFLRDIHAITDWVTVSDDTYLTESGFYNLEFPLQKVSVIRVSGFRYNSDKSLRYALHMKNLSVPADRHSIWWTSGSKLGNESNASLGDDMVCD